MLFKILYVVATMTGNHTIESVGRWNTFEQCEAVRLEATEAPAKTIIAISSSCVPASQGGPLGGFGGGGGGLNSPANSVSPSR